MHDFRDKLLRDPDNTRLGLKDDYINLAKLTALDVIVISSPVILGILGVAMIFTPLWVANAPDKFLTRIQDGGFTLLLLTALMVGGRIVESVVIQVIRARFQVRLPFTKLEIAVLKQAVAQRIRNRRDGTKQISQDSTGRGSWGEP
ncbi:hypothetical protein IQ249_24725 [Lusitaniella coriacea LEGE 07157]|uniref:Uncharacterized protein n=1 Tax=Lusitaniella coriacea LEGE 07157 TaxID=945747 RepID=A0A8J7JF28_9CYAN|nr:hypothetical protein [Lusitaniella coriacea]MBE9119065.1 hypothetical protein [Lusitaniella coriacea LEGE 07157]